MRISDWSSDVCSSDLVAAARHQVVRVLLEEERVLTVGIVAHLDGVGGIVAPDAVDAVNRKDSAVSAYRYDSSLWRCNRSEERRVGKECVSTCRSRWSPDH